MQMWLHVSDTDFGEQVTLTPRIPFCAVHEPPVPRICVAPSIHQCLSAICCDTINDYFVYYSTKPPMKPYGVSDVGITEEMWYTEVTEFKKLMKLSKKFIKKVWAPNDHGRGVCPETGTMANYHAIQIDREWLEYLMHGM